MPVYDTYHNGFLDWLLAHPVPEGMVARMTKDEEEEWFALMESEGVPPTAMDADMADGYMTAVSLMPDPQPIHEWMQTVFGGDTLPYSDEETLQNRLLHLLRLRFMVTCRQIAHAQVPMGDENDIFMPLAVEVDTERLVTPYVLDSEGERKGEWLFKGWSYGFQLAMQDNSLWEYLLADEDNNYLVNPVLIYGRGYNPDQPDFQIDQDRDLQVLLVMSLYDLYRYWQKHYADALAWFTGAVVRRVPSVRDTAKTGRNDPCPCGSGKKYKKCCGT